MIKVGVAKEGGDNNCGCGLGGMANGVVVTEKL